jgi:hypothetical protein
MDGNASNKDTKRAYAGVWPTSGGDFGSCGCSGFGGSRGGGSRRHRRSPARCGQSPPRSLSPQIDNESCPGFSSSLSLLFTPVFSSA